jgi:thioredoxin reductase
MPGVDQDHVLTVFDVFADPARVGQEVVLIDELAQYEAQVTAEFIANMGRKLTFVTRHPVAGVKVDGTSLIEYATRLGEHGVRFQVNTAVAEIDGHTVRGSELLNGDPFEQHADTVVLMMGKVPEDSLFHELRDRVPELHRVGDAVAPRQITEAIWEGNLAARQI